MTVDPLPNIANVVLFVCSLVGEKHATRARGEHQQRQKGREENTNNGRTYFRFSELIWRFRSVRIQTEGEQTEGEYLSIEC